MIISSHQSSFLPYLGFWYKVVSSDVFINNMSSDFSKKSMYHRTYLPKNIDTATSTTDLSLDYFTLTLENHSDGNPLKSVLLKPNNSDMIISRFKQLFGLYKKKTELSKQEFSYIQELLISSVIDAKFLCELNNSFFKNIANYITPSTILVDNDFESGDSAIIQTKTNRLITRLDTYSKSGLTSSDVTYISGSSGKIYIDFDEWKLANKYKLVFQQESDSNYYHGSIIHYLLMNNKQDIINLIKNKFITIKAEEHYNI